MYAVITLVLSFGPFVTASGQEKISLSLGQQFAFDALNGPNSTFVNCTGQFQVSQECDGITFQQESPQAGIQAETIAITSPYQFIRSINDGMQQLIAARASGGSGFSGQAQQSSFLLRSFDVAGSTPSLSTHGFIGPFGVTLSGGGSFGNRDNADGQTGFKVDTRQANLMIDYSFNQKLIGGFSFGYPGADRNLNLNSGSLGSDSYRFAPFLLFRPTANSYLNAMGGYALANYDSTRSVSSFNNFTFGDATAKYDSDQFFASVGGGYTFALKNGWSLRGYARGDYNHMHINSYNEKGGTVNVNETTAADLSMQVNGQTIQSSQVQWGANSVMRSALRLLFLSSFHGCAQSGCMNLKMIAEPLRLAFQSYPLL